jgi:tetratricopeptide (TPR) repeat protein
MDEKAAGLKEIESLIVSDKLKEAYNLCNKLLLNFPESYRLQRQKSKIEKLVFKKNLQLVKDDMDKLKPLWKDHKYSEIAIKLKELQKFVPGYAPLQNQLEKAQNLLLKEKSHEQQHTLAQYLNAAQKYMNEANYKEAITTLKRILLKLPDHEQAKAMLIKAKDLYVDQQIKDREFLLKSDKFDEIAEFIKHLKAVNPDSPKIDALIEKLSKREEMARKFEKMDFTYKSYEDLLVLFQKQKYQACIKGLEELVAMEKDNFKALELLKLAKSKFDKQLTKEIIAKIKVLQKKFKKQKKEMPHEFIRL